MYRNSLYGYMEMGKLKGIFRKHISWPKEFMCNSYSVATNKKITPEDEANMRLVATELYLIHM